MKKRLIGFDLDGTLTQHRTPLGEQNRKVLDKLGEKYALVMIGAGAVPRIYAQMGEYPIDIVGNYGMQEGNIVDGKMCIVREDTVPPDREFFLEQCAYLRRKYGYEEYKGEPVEFHPAGMVTFPLLGTAADIADKLVFDPDRSRRRVLYPEVLEIFKEHSVFIGGSSSFDFTPRRYNKYDALLAYGRSRGYSLEEMLYIGDDFDDGGGDSHIRIYGMDYVKIDDYRSLSEALSFLF